MNLRMWYPILLVLLLASGISLFSLELGITVFLLGSVLSIMGRILKTHGKITLNIEESRQPSDFSLFQDTAEAKKEKPAAKITSNKVSAPATTVSDSGTETQSQISDVHGIDKSVFSKFQDSLDKASQGEQKPRKKTKKKKSAAKAKKASAAKTASKKTPPKTDPSSSHAASLLDESSDEAQTSQEKVTLSSQGKSLAPKTAPAPRKSAAPQKQRASEAGVYSRQQPQNPFKKTGSSTGTPERAPLKAIPPARAKSTTQTTEEPQALRPPPKPLPAAQKPKEPVLSKALEELEVPTNFSDPKLTTPQQQKFFKALHATDEENEESDLFADVHIHLEGDPLLEEENVASDPSTDPLYDEGLSQALRRDDASTEALAEINALLELTHKSFNAKKWSDAQASLDMYLAELRKMGQKPSHEVNYLQTQIANKVEPPAESPAKSAPNPTPKPAQAASSSKTSKKALPAASGDYVKILEELAGSLEKRKAHQELLPILHDLLNHHRQQLNRLEMDRIYERIERTLEALGETERLLRTYKSHLEIKKVLKDRYGESLLLDLIGIHYYKVGDSEQSQHYYEENLRVKASIAREGQNVVTSE